MLETGEIVKLDDDKEYIVVNIMSFHNLRYVFLITNSKPLEFIIATEKIVGGNTVLEEVKDSEEINYILSQFVMTKDSDSDE